MSSSLSLVLHPPSDQTCFCLEPLDNGAPVVAHENGGALHPFHRACVQRIVDERCPTCRTFIDVHCLVTWRERTRAVALNAVVVGIGTLTTTASIGVLRAAMTLRAREGSLAETVIPALTIVALGAGFGAELEQTTVRWMRLFYDPIIDAIDDQIDPFVGMARTLVVGEAIEGTASGIVQLRAAYGPAYIGAVGLLVAAAAVNRIGIHIRWCNRRTMRAAMACALVTCSAGALTFPTAVLMLPEDAVAAMIVIGALAAMLFATTRYVLR